MTARNSSPARKHKLTLASLLMSGASACGDAAFSDGTGGVRLSEITKNQPPAEQLPNLDSNPAPTPVATIAVIPAPPTIGKATSLTWHWNCDGSMSTAPQPVSTDDLVIQDAGPHKFSPDRLVDVPITMQGKVCPVDTSRDILFIVDLSGSMLEPDKGNDPRVNGTCARLEAVRSVIAAAGGANGGKFAIVTFSDNVVFASTSFGSTMTEMLGGADPALTICDAIFNTNYKAPLQRAQTLFASSSRPSASKEIYFISDGVPDVNGSGPNDPLYNGRIEAQALRTMGVKIGTVMLGNNPAGDNYMRTYISSVIQQQGQPDVILHSNSANTNDLARTVTQLSSNDVVSGTFNYRSVGSTAWQSVDLIQYRQGDVFKLPSLRINMGNSPNGLEVDFRYNDRRGSSHAGNGKIVWDK